MLDLESLIRIDPETLRHNIWKRTVNGQSLGSQINPNKDGDVFQNIMNAYQAYVERHVVKKDESRENIEEQVKALELPLDRMPTKEEIKKSHRKLAFKHHPDRNPTDADAAKRFDHVQKAYDKLSDTHEYAERAVEAQQKVISGHLSTHRGNLGWTDRQINEGKSAAFFPVDHLHTDQKGVLLGALKDQGYLVEEHFSQEIGCNVVKVTKNAEAVTGAEVCQKLQAWVKNKNSVGSSINNAVKAGEEAAAKTGGKAKWIIGGIVAATVAIGAFVAYKKKSATEREEERRKNNETVAHGVS